MSPDASLLTELRSPFPHATSGGRGCCIARRVSTRVATSARCLGAATENGLAHTRLARRTTRILRRVLIQHLGGGNGGSASANWIAAKLQYTEHLHCDEIEVLHTAYLHRTRRQTLIVSVKPRQNHHC